MILPKVELTPSGRPKLATGEIERVLLDKVDLEFDGVGGTEGCQTAERYQNGYVVATSHRLIWIDAAGTANSGRSCHLPVECIHSTRKHLQYGLNLMNPKVRLEVKVYVDLGSKPTTMQASATFAYLQLRCRGESPDPFSDQLNAAIQARKQQQEQQQQQQQRRQQQRQHLSAPSSPSHAAQLRQQQAPSWGLSVSTGAFGPGAMSAASVGPMSAALPGSPMSTKVVQHIQAVDKELLDSLVEMGFPRQRVLRALLATNNENMQAALDWILAAGEDPATDQPFKQAEPAAVTRQELLQLQRLQQQHPGFPPQQQQPPQQGLGQQQLGGGLVPGWGVGTVGSAAVAASGPHLAPAGAVAVSLCDPYSNAGLGGAASSGPQPQRQRPSPGSSVIGVAGIMHREAEKTSQTSANLAVAFRDLDNLMGMAADMVKLAEKFRGVMGPDGAITLTPATIHASHSAPAALDQANTAAGGDGSASNEQLLLDAETQLQLIAMGIASPVTKASAGARYQQELSRQLADFLASPLARAGGVLLLSDVYCLFNRARGTELVSPDDLMQACEAFSQVGLPLRIRKFPSGVIVVQGSQFSDAQLCNNIEQLLQKKKSQTPQQLSYSTTLPGVPELGPPLSASDVSAALSLPLTLAKEALLVAETRGVLCRDDGPEGLRFFRNFFKAAQPVVAM